MVIYVLTHFRRYLGAMQSLYEHHLIQYIPWCVARKVICKPKHPFSLFQRALWKVHGPICSLSCHMAQTNTLPGPMAITDHPTYNACPASPSPSRTRVSSAGAAAAGKTTTKTVLETRCWSPAQTRRCAKNSADPSSPKL